MSIIWAQFFLIFNFQTHPQRYNSQCTGGCALTMTINFLGKQLLLLWGSILVKASPQAPEITCILLGVWLFIQEFLFNFYRGDIINFLPVNRYQTSILKADIAEIDAKRSQSPDTQRLPRALCLPHPHDQHIL